MAQGLPRRGFLQAAAGAALTGYLSTNRQAAVAFIGCGRVGTANIEFAARAGAQIAAVCDLDPPAMERAQAMARRLGFGGVQAHRDFREILADKSIDAVSIATPDHWHASMTIEACKAGKDVWCETPACVYVEEGLAVVRAARKYQRVVQAGTVQRSGAVLQRAREIVRSGELGAINFCAASRSGDPRPDRRIDLIDAIQFAFNEAMPVSVSAQGGILATYRYPGFVAAYERRAAGKRADGVAFYGARDTLVVNLETSRQLAAMRVAHWQNFLECVRTRRKPVSDIETCVRSTITCLLSDPAPGRQVYQEV